MREKGGFYSPSLIFPLVVSIILLISLSSLGLVCAAAADESSMIRVTVLLEGENISSTCLGTVVNTDTGAMALLSPVGDVLSATVAGGRYELVVVCPQDTSLMPQILDITAVPGQTIERLISLGHVLDIVDMANEDGSYFSGPRDDDKDPSHYPQGNYGSVSPSDYAPAPGGSDAGDRDDSDGEEEPDPIPVGEVLVEWKAACRTEETQSDHYVFDEFSPFFPGGHSEKTKDQMQVIYSGTYQYKVMGVADGFLDLEDGTGAVKLTGGGSGELQEEDIRTDLCIRGNEWSEKQFKSSMQAVMEHRVATRDNVLPPFVHIYPDTCELRLPQFYEARYGRTKVITKTRNETCDGVETSSFDTTHDNGPPLCEMVISQALSSPDFREQLTMTRPPGSDFTISGNAAWEFNPKELGLLTPSNQPTPVDDNQGRDYSVEGSLEVSYTITYTRYPVELELVIIPPEDYQEWMPEADENPKSRGNSIEFYVELQNKTHPGQHLLEQEVKFEFELVDTSREAGVCLNYPSQDKAQKTYDLRISPDSGLIVSKDGQSAHTENYERAAVVLIDSFDWGAYGRLQVTATTRDGQTLVGYLEHNEAQKEVTIPLDQNNNHIADCWEKDHNLYDQSLPPDWDESPKPEKQKANGDGFSLFEKYRGFWTTVAGTDAFFHERLNPNWKYLFIYDPDGIVEKMETSPHTRKLRFSTFSQLRLRFIDDQHWTGSGSSSEGKRIVNFNGGYGHATDQHAVHVAVTQASGDKMAFPPGYDEALRKVGKRAGTAPPAMAGMAWVDYQSKFGPPKHTFKVDILPDVIWQMVMDYAIKAAGVGAQKCQLGNSNHYQLKPKMPSSSDFPDWRDHDQAMAKYGEELAEWAREGREIGKEWLEDYVKTHPNDLEIAVEKHTARVLSHELCHAIGVEHHHHRGVPMPYDPPGPSKGNQKCVVWIDYKLCYDWWYEGSLNDPFHIRVDESSFSMPWPLFLCGDPAGGESAQAWLEHAHDVGCWRQVIVSDRYD